MLQHFFVYGAGTSDLRQFFTFLPYPCIVLVPAVALFVHHASTERGFDAMLPYSELQKALASVTCAVIGFGIALLPSLLIPSVVDFFGDADRGQFVAGTLGSILFIATACSLCDFLYRLFDTHDALAFALSALILAVFSYVPKGFLWLCSSFASGILNSRDVLFYITCILFFLFLSEAVQLIKKGKHFAKSDKQLVALELFVLALLLIVSARLHTSADISRSKAFSISSYSRTLLDRAQSPVRIRYFVSPRLRRQYSQIADIRDYLAHFADTVPHVVFLEQNADTQEAQEFLTQDYGRSIAILRIIDREKDKFVIPQIYKMNRNIAIFDIVTKPEIEILHIITEGLDKEYKRARNNQKSNLKPSSFCKGIFFLEKSKFSNI